jgi:hypothetical protein
MTIKQIGKLLSQEIVINHIAMFGGNFFVLHLGESLYETKGGCFYLGEYEETLRLIEESLKEGNDLLPLKLKKVENKNTRT